MALTWLEGLKVTQMNSPGMTVKVQSGVIEVDGKRIAVAGAESLTLKPPPQLKLRKQYYTLEREGMSSPCGWDWSGRRGSNFKPYQMRVPSTLRVFAVDELTEYVANEDYVYDDYWGSVMVKPGGRLQVNDPVLLEYDVYTCRYHLICVDAEGGIDVVEGDWRYKDETNLLLPDPPVAPHGSLTLASVFIPWGATAVYERGCFVEYCDGTDQFKLAEHFVWDSRHVDYEPRIYEVVASGHEEVSVRTDLCAYGGEAGRPLTQPIEESGEVDLPVARADGLPVYWQVHLPWRKLLIAYPLLKNAKVHTYPANIMDLRGIGETIETAMKLVTIEGNNVVPSSWSNSVLAKNELQLCFLGESTTYGGDWPLLIVKRLQQLLPAKKIHWSNASDGGHSSVHGISHVTRTQSFGHVYDIVFIEYLINDTNCETDDIYSAMTGIISWVRERNPGAVVVIIASNGGNPMFSPRYNPVHFDRVYTIHRRVAEEQEALFIGMYDCFRNLDQLGTYFITELKENMINHPYMDTAIDGTRWDQWMAETFIRWISVKLPKRTGSVNNNESHTI